MDSRRLPSGGVCSYRFTEDGDKIIDAVTYPTVKGGQATVKFERGIDGDMTPTTGFTMDGDYDWPGQQYDL